MQILLRIDLLSRNVNHWFHRIVFRPGIVRRVMIPFTKLTRRNLQVVRSLRDDQLHIQKFAGLIASQAALGLCLSFVVWLR